MKKIILLLIALSSTAYASHGNIDAYGLKALMDSNTSYVLLDARGDNWNDPNIIQGAKFGWHQDTVFDDLIPAKDSLVIVYCFSQSCPLGPRLAKKLTSLGYKNLIEYPGGLQEWRDVLDLPVEVVSRW